jgi:hypothetical protein
VEKSFKVAPIFVQKKPKKRLQVIEDIKDTWQHPEEVAAVVALEDRQQHPLEDQLMFQQAPVVGGEAAVPCRYGPLC